MLFAIPLQRLRFLQRLIAMEALALIGGVLAVIQAGDRLVTLLDQIRPLFEAPTEVDSLINEITRLRAVFGDVETTIRDVSPSVILSHQERYTSIAQVIKQGNDVLLELQSCK